ncbi:MAG: hypothetical protein ABJI22_18750 [Maribacter sp.]
MVAEVKQVVLNVEIRNNEPLELTELTKSLIALSNQYNNHSEKIGFSETERNAKLYVKKIETGSVLLDLIEFGSSSVIPFLESTNTLVGFAQFLSSSVEFLLTKEGDKPELSIQDCKDFSQIVNPIANDSSSQLNVNVTINGDVKNYLSIDSNKSNALQNILKQEIRGKQELKNGDILENAIMIFSQTKNKISSKGGNKVIIDDALPGKSINVIFLDQKVKRKIIKGNDNPNNFSFQVDVKVKTANDKIAAYEILKVHDKFPLKET